MSIPSFESDTASGQAMAEPVRDVEPRLLPLVEESLSVQKRRVDEGGWRISKQVTSRQETVDEPLQSEQVTVERREIGEILASLEPPAPRQEGDTWILPVVEEVLVTEKRLLLKEEIRITRIHATRRQPQQITLRSEEVSIERLEPGYPSDIGSP